MGDGSLFRYLDDDRGKPGIITAAFIALIMYTTLDGLRCSACPADLRGSPCASDLGDRRGNCVPDISLHPPILIFVTKRKNNGISSLVIVHTVTAHVNVEVPTAMWRTH